jgi:hypothetical protein
LPCRQATAQRPGCLHRCFGACLNAGAAIPKVGDGVGYVMPPLFLDRAMPRYDRTVTAPALLRCGFFVPDLCRLVIMIFISVWVREYHRRLWGRKPRQLRHRERATNTSLPRCYLGMRIAYPRALHSKPYHDSDGQRSGYSGGADRTGQGWLSQFEPRPGGIIGVEAVSRSAPDGSRLPMDRNSLHIERSCESRYRSPTADELRADFQSGRCPGPPSTRRALSEACRPH